MTEKRCFKCGKKKSITEFYKHSEMSDGHLGKCKTCTKKDTRKNYRDNIDYYREYERERSQRDERKKLALKYQRKRRKRNPKKYKARVAVGNAIRDGRLEKEPCEVCGKEEVEAHHEDYNKPLSVRWLCFDHHRKIHNQLDYR